MSRVSLRSDDGTALSAVQWAPSGEPKGDVLVLHGVNEHIGRYEHVGAALTAAGYRVTGLDFRGHGESEGRRAHVDRWDQFVDDVRAAARFIGSPHAIVAHSMGGLVALDHLRDGDAIAAVVTAPALGVAVKVPRWKEVASGILNKLTPRLLMANELRSEWLTRDQDMIAIHDADPLVTWKVSVRWFNELLDAQERVRLAARSMKTPLLLQWGTDDRIVSGEAIEAFSAQYGGSVDTRVFQDHRHELFNEIGREQIITDSIAWLDSAFGEA